MVGTTTGVDQAVGTKTVAVGVGTTGTATVDKTVDGRSTLGMMTIDGDPGMVTMCDDGTSETTEAGTMIGLTHGDGMVTVDGTETVLGTGTTTVITSVSGTDDGMFTDSMMATDGYDGMVMMSLGGKVETAEIGTKTGLVHLGGTETWVMVT
jgi:hypothetical protein